VNVVVVDHGAGNLRSLAAGIERAGGAVEISADAGRVAAARRLVLPGVGQAAAAVERMRSRDLLAAVREAAAAGAHVLGICLGMQLLFERSDEGNCDCLGLLPGRVEAIGWAERVPHMGWNDVRPRTAHPLTAGLPAVCWFAHSFAAVAADRRDVLAATDLDSGELPSLVGRDRIAGAQFHPERSGRAGAALLRGFLEWSADAA
jgi:glutamine amidotransferase